MVTKFADPPGAAAKHAPAGRSIASTQLRQICTPLHADIVQCPPVTGIAPTTFDAMYRSVN